MPTIRGEEEWARRCISGVFLEAEVIHHDDGSMPGMHDLEIVYEDRPVAAAEVTAAADSESIELWNLINAGESWIEPTLVGGWGVALLPKARARRIRRELPGLLKQLEEKGIKSVRTESDPPGRFEVAAHDLGITHLFQSGTACGGSIHPTIELSPERSGGGVAETGDPLVAWLEEWITRADQFHNLVKLRNSGAEERHLFVIVPGFSDAPFQVSDLLMRDGAPLPRVPPRLPEEVTHVWLMSTWTIGVGMRWSPEGGWSRFDKGM